MTRKKQAKPSKLHDREFELIRELQDKHAYWFTRMSQASKRYTATFSRGAKETTFGQRYALQFVIPLDSALAIAMIEADTVLDKSKKRKARR